MVALGENQRPHLTLSTATPYSFSLLSVDSPHGHVARILAEALDDFDERSTVSSDASKAGVHLGCAERQHSLLPCPTSSCGRFSPAATECERVARLLAEALDDFDGSDGTAIMNGTGRSLGSAERPASFSAHPSHRERILLSQSVVAYSDGLVERRLAEALDNFATGDGAVGLGDTGLARGGTEWHRLESSPLLRSAFAAYPTARPTDPSVSAISDMAAPESTPLVAVSAISDMVAPDSAPVFTVSAISDMAAPKSTPVVEVSAISGMAAPESAPVVAVSVLSDVAAPACVDTPLSAQGARESLDAVQPIAGMETRPPQTVLMGLSVSAHASQPAPQWAISSPLGGGGIITNFTGFTQALQLTDPMQVSAQDAHAASVHAMLGNKHETSPHAHLTLPNIMCVASEHDAYVDSSPAVCMALTHDTHAALRPHDPGLAAILFLSMAALPLGRINASCSTHNQLAPSLGGCCGADLGGAGLSVVSPCIHAL